MSVKYITGDPCPTWEFDLGEMRHYSEILKAMKSLKISDYVYAFIFNGIVIKYGLSIPSNTTSDSGERIYRQAGNLDGWGIRLHGSSGKDMIDIDAEYFAQTGNHLNRNGMKIIIMDQTEIQSPNASDKKWHVKQLERKLIKEHVDQFGYKPIGNIKDEAYIDGKAFVSVDLWNNLFEDTND